MARRNERCAALNCRCSLSGNNNLCGWPKAVRQRPGHKCFIPLNPDISVLYTVGNTFDPVRRVHHGARRVPRPLPLAAQRRHGWHTADRHRLDWPEREASATRHPHRARADASRGGIDGSGAVEAQAPAHLVLVHDRVGVPAGDARVVGEPMSSLFAAEERGTRFEPVEPLSEAAAGNDRNACNEARVQIR